MLRHISWLVHVRAALMLLAESTPVLERQVSQFVKTTFFGTGLDWRNNFIRLRLTRLRTQALLYVIPNDEVVQPSVDGFLPSRFS